MNITKILAQAALGERLTKVSALALAQLTTVDQLHALGQAALANRLRRFGRKATYVLNLAINPSNICFNNCKFCHYHTAATDPESYILSQAEILKQIADGQPREVHITGGLNEHWAYPQALELIEQIRSLHPSIYIKAYTAVEIEHFALASRQPTVKILKAFLEAGLNSLTGGGAEIFSARMRAEYCPTKLGPERWIEIHLLAHNMGISSNATMLYGLGETPEEIVDHLFALREAQDKYGGFSCFIPLAYQPAKDHITEHSPSPLENLKMIALARLILDNFPHIKAYWPMIGLETAAIGLSWGADDLDGTLGKERIAHAGATTSPEAVSRQMMVETIEAGGFEACERAGDFSSLFTKGEGL